MSVPNDVYWADRFAILEEIQNQDGREQIRKLKRAYKKAISDIEKDVSAWYERFANTEGITLGEARKILDAGQLDAFKMSVEDYIAKGESLDPKWRADLERASVKVHISRLEALKLQMQQHVEELTSGMQSLMDDYAESSYKKQYYRTAFEVQKGIRLGWDLQKLDKTQVSKVVRKPWAADGTNFSDRIWKNRTKLVNELHTTLTSSIARGENPTKTIEKLSTKMHNSEFNAGRVVMTEGAFFASAAKQDAFKTLDVEKYEIVATLDRKTSNICRDLDGKIFERKDYVIGSTAPPFHPFCRTTTAPYFDDANDSVRAARNDDGDYYEVPANMTYREWEKTFIDGGDKSALKPSNSVQTKKPEPVKSSNDEFAGLRTKFYATTNLEERDKILQQAGVQFKDKLKTAGVFELKNKHEAKLQAMMDKAEQFRAQHITGKRNTWDNSKNVFEYRGMLEAIQKERADLKYDTANAVKSVLSKYRNLGFGDINQTDVIAAGRSPMRKRVLEAVECYPQEWIKALSTTGPYRVKKVDRGYYNSGSRIIAISGELNGDSFETSVHELGHGFEFSIQDIRMAEAQFFDRRTQGCSLEKLKDIFPNSGYDDWEITYRDDFIHPYMGKDYEGQAFELVSMGFELLYTNPSKLAQDEDMLHFILGLLVLITE